MTCLYEGVDGITWLSFPVQDSALRLGLSLLPSLSIWESLRIHCWWTWSLAQVVSTSKRYNQFHPLVSIPQGLGQGT